MAYTVLICDDELLERQVLKSIIENSNLPLKIVGEAKRSPRGGSSHYTYSHPDLKDIITIPKDRPIKLFYIKKALSAFEIVKDEF
jgi:predicted RNA binding protein YcfA (HicA-like mRNA interferase family)